MFRTTNEILDHVSLFRHNLRNIYFRVEDIEDKKKLDLILDFTEEHRKRLQENLKLFENETPDKIKKAWLTYISRDDLPHNCRDLLHNSGMSVNEVIHMALKFEACLILFYEKVVEKCPFPEVQNIFSNLLQLAKRDKLDIIKKDHGVYV